MWAVYNRNGERMYQYPASEHEDQALGILRRAQENNPRAGFRLRRVEDGEKIPNSRNKTAADPLYLRKKKAKLLI